MTSFEGVTPPTFRLEGRIVSNRVELSGAGVELDKPCLLKIPHFAADERGEKEMYVAALHEQEARARKTGEDGEELDESRNDTTDEGAHMFVKLTGGAQFNIGTGYSTVWIKRLGTFYVCSSIANGVDYTVTSYTIPSHVSGTTFNAVAFDWIEGEASLWSRTSLNRPPGKDGPVFVRRKSRLTVDFNAKRIAGTVPLQAPTFPETFQLSSNNYNLLTGVVGDSTSKSKTHDDPFDTVEFQMQVVPGDKMEIIEEKQRDLEQTINELNNAEDQKSTLGLPFEPEERQPYLDRIQEARTTLKEVRNACLPWSDRSDLPASKEEPSARDPAAEDQAPAGGGVGNIDLLADTAAPNVEPVVKSSGQPYKDLPAWEGRDLNIVFGAQMIPDTGFQEDHLVMELAVVMAEKDAEERRLLEVPEMPAPGGRFRKVWVGPPKDKIFTYAPMMTRASFAELVVNVRLGAWHHRCTITLSTSGHTLADVRSIVQSHCYGRDLSEARFVMGNGQQVVDITQEHRVRAQTQRPTISLWGNSHRPSVYFKNNVVLSFTSDLFEYVSGVYENLKTRGFPVWMDIKSSGANSIEGLNDAAMIICFLSPKYNDQEHTCAEYVEATKRNIPKLHIWTSRFETRGWLKTTIREQKGRFDLGNDRARHHELDIAKSPLDSNMTSQQLDR